MKRKSYLWLLSGLVLTLALLNVAPLPIRAQADNRVALVVRFDNETVVTRCVEFGEAQISGYDVLTRSGLDVVADVSGADAAICAINGTGCPADNCFCQSPPDYWSYWHLQDGRWVYAQGGASSHQVGDGDVEGWSWGQGEPPPMIPFERICTVPPTATPVPPTPTATPVPPTATPVPPTATPLPLPEAWFRLDTNPVDAGTCTYVRWDTWDAAYVYLDGEPVSLKGSREVCPVTPLDTTLRVGNDYGEEVYTLTLGVVGATLTPTSLPTSTPEQTATAPPPTATFTPTPTSTPTSTPTQSPTSQPTSAVTPSSTATPSPSPAATPRRSPTPTTTPTAASTPLPAAPPPSELSSYWVFGVLTAGLLAGLLWFAQRRR